MKRQSVQKAYRNIRPTEKEKAKMLDHILSSASEIPPAGKDDTMNRRKMKPLVIAAIIALMILMMGCAVISLSLQEMKIGESSSRGEILDSDGNVVKESEILKDVISLQGMKDTPSQMAAKEWFEFEKEYDQDLRLVSEADKNGFEAPEEYDAYHVYTQEMIDKVDEIAAKYGLKLAGAAAMVQNWEKDIFFDALGLERLHHADAQAEVEYLSGYFYACGNFSFDYGIILDEGWPYEILTSMRYNDKEYLDTVAFWVDSIERMEQWNYTTADGTEVLIAMDKNYARIFCDRDDAFVSAYFDVSHEYDSGEVKYMSKADVEAVADVIDFTVKPQKPDMDAVHMKLESAEKEMQAKQELDRENGVEYGYKEFIADRMEALEHPEDVYYTLVDIDENGVVDLLMGHEDQIEVAWTIAYDENAGYEHMNFVPLTDEQWSELEKAWPDMEIYPITTYPMD